MKTVDGNVYQCLTYQCKVLFGNSFRLTEQLDTYYETMARLRDFFCDSLVSKKFSPRAAPELSRPGYFRGPIEEHIV